ncbi:MAG: aldehyde ferredoxin oxidoreductase family protein [Promethearchaeia archaeon]
MKESVKNKYYGFSGKLIEVDLTDLKASVTALNKKYAKKFMGGAGFVCRYLYEYIGKDTDALGRDNIMMIMNGPFSATKAPCFGRFVICAKSPYTQLWGEANCGGTFGPELRKAGFDGILIKGKAEDPVYIKIEDTNIKIVTDKSLWGKNIKETRKILKERVNDDHAKVLCIGQAGENLVKYANINAEGRSAGRTGMGAVLGSKNLKGIVVRGKDSKPKIAHPEKFDESVKKTLKFILDTDTTQIMRSYGTSSGVLGAYAVGDLPIKYWSKGKWEDVMDISAEEYKEDLFLKAKACYGCPIGCGRIVNIESDKYRAKEVEGPEYETIAGFGSMILNNNLDSIAVANDICNKYGLDTISTSGTIALMFKLYNEGKIDKNEVEGLELEWGNYKAMLTLIEKIAHREGIGDLLAEGSNAVGKKFGISPEEIATVNQLEVPYHDPRSCFGMALTYAFSHRGACHTTADVYKASRKTNEIDFSELKIKKIDMHSSSKEMAKATTLLQDYRALYSSLIACIFSNPPPSYMAEMINSLLGFDIDVEGIKVLGERIFTMKRLFNIKMGLTPSNDRLPEILLKELHEGVVRGKSPNFRKLKRYYYDIRDWNPETGKPNNSKLKELDLDNFLH